MSKRIENWKNKRKESSRKRKIKSVRDCVRVCVRMCYVRTLTNDKIRSRRNKTGSSSNNSSLNNSAGSAAPSKTVVSTSSSSKRGGVPFHLRSSYPVPARKNHVASGCGTNAGNPDRANRSVCGFSPPAPPRSPSLFPLETNKKKIFFRFWVIRPEVCSGSVELD